MKSPMTRFYRECYNDTQQCYNDTQQCALRSNQPHRNQYVLSEAKLCSKLWETLQHTNTLTSQCPNELMWLRTRTHTRTHTIHRHTRARTHARTAHTSVFVSEKYCKLYKLWRRKNLHLSVMAVFSENTTTASWASLIHILVHLVGPIRHHVIHIPRATTTLNKKKIKILNKTK